MSISKTHLPLILLALAAAPSAVLAQDSVHERLMGLWEVTEVKDLTTGEVEPLSRQFHVFTKTHEMIVLAGADRPKLEKSLSEMSAEEMATQQPIGAGFYEYTIEDGVMTRTAKLALSAFYEGRVVKTEFEISGDRLITRDRHVADGHLRQWTMRRVE